MRTGYGPFENDDATDLIDDLIDEDDLEILIEEMEGWEAVDADSPLSAVDAARIVAAAEVAAALHGRAHERLPRHLARWLEDQMPIDATTRRRLLSLLQRVRKHSELSQRIADSPDAEAWVAQMQDLEHRLVTPAAVG